MPRFGTKQTENRNQQSGKHFTFTRKPLKIVDSMAGWH